MKTSTPLCVRASRFLNERYQYRERGYFIDLSFWALIVSLATWPMLLLAAALER
jgi:hypothetical protein